jgi:excisionase family DNA binding protein
MRKRDNQDGKYRLGGKVILFMDRSPTEQSELENKIMNADDLFTAPQVAKICSTDLKTIHNWVNRGEIKSFRTPGRHLRFRREDILEFLTRFGYPIPDGFSPSRKRLVLCDETDALRRSLKRSLSRDFEVEAFADHVDALLAVGRQRPDLLVVNGTSGEDVVHLVARLAAGKDAAQILVYGEGVDEAAYNGKGASIEFAATSDTKEIRKNIVTVLTK